MIEKNYTSLKIELINQINLKKSKSKLLLREKIKALGWFFSFDKDSLPENWLEVNIQDVTWLVTCGVAKKPNYIDEGIPFLSAQNARPFKTNLNKIKYISKNQFDILTSGGKPEKDDILYTRVGNCGEAAKVPFDFDFAIYVSLTLIKPIHELIDTDFLVAYLNSHFGLVQANIGSIGSGLKNLNVNNVRKYKIPLPPLPEQKRIVAKLDTLFGHLDTLKAKLDRIPELLKNFRHQVLTQAVTGKLTEEWRKGKRLGEWEVVELGTVANVIDPHPSHRMPPIHHGGIPYVSIKDVEVDGNVNLDGARPVAEHVLQEHINRYELKVGDFGFGKVGTLGKPFLLPDFKARMYALSYNIILVQPRRNCVAKFIFYFMDSPIIEQKLREEANATSQPALGIKKAREFPTPLPELAEQEEIIRRVDGLFALADNIESRYQSLIKKIDNLPQAILKKAFKGELAPQDPNDEPVSVLLERIKGDANKIITKTKMLA